MAFRLRFQLRRRAFRSIFSRSVNTPLQKDAAPIPNALGDISISSGDATEVMSHISFTSGDATGVTSLQGYSVIKN